MDLIYTDESKSDLGVLLHYDFDLAFGEDENNFECTISAKDHCCQAGYFLYIEGTEYGGIIDTIKSDTANDNVTYTGRTWHGMLASKIIMPLQAGESSTSTVTIKSTDTKGDSLVNRYLILSGDANECLRFLINRLGLSDLFQTPSNAAGVNINKYQFNRYCDGYSGIFRMLDSAGLKLCVSYKNGTVMLSAIEKADHSNDGEFDSDLIAINVEKQYKTVNHLICLGAGELENRKVVHLYADSAGNISQTQSIFGLDEYTAAFDYTYAESEEELIAEGKEKLKSMLGYSAVSVDLDDSIDNYDVGDTVAAIDNVTGVTAKATVTKKIVTIQNGKISIAIGTGDVSGSGSNSTGDGTGASYATKEELTAHVDSVDNPHSVTSAQVGASNRNLLDNYDFRCPINQRGQTTYTANGYTIDRWFIPGASANVTMYNGYISCVATTNNYVLDQYVDRYLIEDGEKYTVSILYDDGTLLTATGSSAAEFYTPAYNGWLAGIQVSSTTAVFYIACRNVNVPANIAAVKLEKGAVSTILNDAPMDRLDMLQRCKQYYQRFRIGGAANNNYLGGMWVLPVQMHSETGSLTLSTIYTSNGIVTITQGGIFFYEGKAVKADCLVSANAGYYFEAEVILECN